MYYNIYCDGAATMKKVGNEYVRCAGGYGVVVYDTDNIIISQLSGAAAQTTNNEQELTAIYEALKWLWECGNTAAATIYSDSAYCINIFTQWADGWAARGWTRKGNKPIENCELIKSIYFLLKEMPQIKFEKVKGHDKCVGNILADELAVKAKQSIA